MSTNGGDTSGPMLVVENIHVYYGNIAAVKGISLEVKKGEIVTLDRKSVV